MMSPSRCSYIPGYLTYVHLDHKGIDCVIRDCGIPDDNDTLIKGSRVVDENLKALMVNWDLWSLMIRLHRECQSCAFIN